MHSAGPAPERPGPTESGVVGHIFLLELVLQLGESIQVKMLEEWVCVCFLVRLPYSLFSLSPDRSPCVFSEAGDASVLTNPLSWNLGVTSPVFRLLGVFLNLTFRSTPWISTGCFCSSGTFGDVWGRLWWLRRGVEAVTGIWWVETRDAAECPTMHRAAPRERLLWPQKSTVLWLRILHHSIQRLGDRSL